MILYHLHLLYCLLKYVVATYGYVTGSRGATAYVLATPGIREQWPSGIYLGSVRAADPSWPHRGVNRGGPNLCAYRRCTCKYAHADTHQTQSSTSRRQQAPSWTLWTWKPSSIKKCTIWLGCRKVALCFVSVQGWTLLFCLWMLSSCFLIPHTAASAASVLVGPARPLVALPAFPRVIRSTCWDGLSPPVNYNPASSVYLCSHTHTHTLSLSCRHSIVKYAIFFSVIPGLGSAICIARTSDGLA